MSAVAVIGAPGAGKTTVGAQVAQRLGMTFVDSDAQVADQTGKPLTELFVTSGERGVRELQRQVICDALGDEVVVAVASGAIEDASVRAALEDARVVWLAVEAPNAFSRLGLNVPRPVALGNVRAQFSAMLAEREQLYAQSADLRVTTDHRSVSEVVEEVAMWISEGAPQQ